MEIEFLPQPNHTKSLGSLLISQLDRRPAWGFFSATIAFVKSSGINFIGPHLKSFISAGGVVHIIVGVDHQGTSIEGLNTLIENVKSGGQIWVFHNERFSTFHPKVYVFEGSDSAYAMLGSGNMTEGGLFTNYEAGVGLGLDLNIAEDRQFLDDYHDYFARLLSNGEIARELSAEFLDEL